MDAIVEIHHGLLWDITGAERDWSIFMADAGYVPRSRGRKPIYTDHRAALEGLRAAAEQQG
jgi:hypothetical protein